MRVVEYSVKKGVEGAAREIPWGARGSLLVRLSSSERKTVKPEQDREVSLDMVDGKRPNRVYVLGFVKDRKGKMTVNYQIEPVPIKMQGNCRAYLRGYSEGAGKTEERAYLISPRASISFAN